MRAGRRAALQGIALSAAVVAVLLGSLVWLGAVESITSLLEWFEAKGSMGLLLFILVMALVTVFLLPGALFTTGAGAIFGVVEGTVGVVLGTTLGATLAFLIARLLFGARAARYVMNHARIRGISEKLTRHGWQVVLLTRLVPFFPAKLANYVFGLSQFSLSGFVVGTLLGIIPLSLHNVYLGSLAADLTQLGDRRIDRTPVEWGIYAVGLLLILGAVIMLGRIAGRALSAYEQIEDT